MSKRLVNVGVASQQNNLQGRKPKSRELTGTFFLFKPFQNI